MGDDYASDLLQRGLTAMDVGDNEAAVDYLRQAVEADPDSLEGWEALANVVDDPDEKEVALNQVLRLDPDHKQAQKELNKIEKKRKRAEANPIRGDGNEEWVPGIKRRELRIAIIGLGIFTVVVFGAAFALISSVNQREAQFQAEVAAQETRVAQVTETSVAAGIASQTAEYQAQLDATSTQLALTTATPTPTETPNLPPTFTPTAGATEMITRLFELPPAEVTGTIYGWGGPAIVSREYLELRTYPLASDGAYTQLNDDLVKNVSVNESATVATYQRYFTSQSLAAIYQVNLVDPEVLPTDLDFIYTSDSIFTAFDPQTTRDGNKMVFIGQDITEERTGVYMADLTTNEVVVISRDSAQYRQPTISDDGSYIAAVREDEAGRVDLILFDLTQPLTESGFVTVDLTIDGEAIIEAYPRFSPDAGLLAYSAAASSTPNNHEIFIIGLSNGQPAPGNIPVATAPYDEIWPVFSPDGNYLAYGARVTDTYDILIRDLSGNDVYQLTEDESSNFPGDWIN